MLTIGDELVNSVVLIRLGGEIRILDDAIKVWMRLRQYLLRGHKRFVIDMKNISAMPEEIMHEWQRRTILAVFNNHQGKVVLLDPPDDYAEYLRLIGGDQLLKRYYDQAEAIASFAQPTP